MILLNDFFTIQSVNKTGEGYGIEVQLNPSHDIFRGHFPGNPVVPGVCMVQMIKEILEQLLETSLTMKQASQLKFLTMLSPEHNKSVRVDLSTLKAEADGWHISGSITSGELVFVKYKMFLVPAVPNGLTRRDN